MDIALIIIAGLLIVVGILGSVLPVLPGSPLCWFGLLLIHFTEKIQFTTTFLVVTAIFAVVVILLDYFIPIWGTKRFGGSKAGVTGATIGLIFGLFLGPVGIIFGPFIGAFLGEMLNDSKEVKKALKSATGSFLGFIFGTGLKLIYGGFCAWYFVSEVFF
jgi:uncharacterized protein YqgC (DUF456 family)